MADSDGREQPAGDAQAPEAAVKRERTPEERSAQRRKDFWQLDLPLAFAVVLCTTLTIIELRRANEGVWRAWAYTFEWPLIGIICCWIWYRYRSEGSITKRFTSRWRARVERYEAEFEAADHPASTIDATIDPADEQLQEWQRYVDDLHRREPPGQPPPDEVRN